MTADEAVGLNILPPCDPPTPAGRRVSYTPEGLKLPAQKGPRSSTDSAISGVSSSVPKKKKKAQRASTSSSGGGPSVSLWADAATPATTLPGAQSAPRAQGQQGPVLTASSFGSEGAGSPRERFSHVLSLVQLEHDREVKSLRQELENLRRQIDSPPGAAPVVCLSEEDVTPACWTPMIPLPSTLPSNQAPLPSQQVSPVVQISTDPPTQTLKLKPKKEMMIPKAKAEPIGSGSGSPKVRISFNPTMAADSDSDEEDVPKKETMGVVKELPEKMLRVESKEKTSNTRRFSGTYARDLLPAKFDILTGWTPGAVKVRSIPGRRSYNTKKSSEGVTHEKVIGRTGCSKYIWHPHSQRRLYWDLLGMALLGHDLIMIPFKTAFVDEEAQGWDWYNVMTTFTVLFWMCDMVLSFLTGYTEAGGIIIMDAKRIAQRYCFTWLPLDLTLVSFDILLLTIWNEDNSSESNEATKLGRSLRTLRFLRSLRLLRLLKLKRIFQEIQDNIDSEVISTYWGIFKITLMIVTANHIIACIWYSIGVTTDDGPDSNNWVRDHNMFDTDLGYRYCTAMHWSLTQFTPASMEVYPRNSAERLYTIIVVLFAMVTFSSFVSTLTSNMTHLRNRTANETRQFWLLRRYLKDLNITKITSLRVQRYLEHAYRMSQLRVQERDVALLALLSKPLREEVKHESFAPHLEIHPLFQWMGEHSRCFTTALQAVSLASKDLYFSCGQKAEQMLFVVDGELQYLVHEEEDGDSVLGLDGGLYSDDAFMMDDMEKSASGLHSMPSMFSYNTNNELHSMTSEDVEEDDDEFEEGDLSAKLFANTWICEAVLWTNWVHLGELQSYTNSQLIALNAAAFGEEVKKDTALWSTLHKYAGLFVEELNITDKILLTDMMDQHFSPKHILRKCAVSRHTAIRGEMKGMEERGSLGSFTTQFWKTVTSEIRRAGVRQGTPVTTIKE